MGKGSIIGVIEEDTRSLDYGSKGKVYGLGLGFRAEGLYRHPKPQPRVSGANAKNKMGLNM